MTALADVQYAIKQLRGSMPEHYDLVESLHDVLVRITSALAALDRAAESLALREAAETLARVASSGEAAVKIIVQFMEDYNRDWHFSNDPKLEVSARCLLARLASHDPPILVGFPDEFKD